MITRARQIQRRKLIRRHRVDRFGIRVEQLAHSAHITERAGLKQIRLNTACHNAVRRGKLMGIQGRHQNRQPLVIAEQRAGTIFGTMCFKGVPITGPGRLKDVVSSRCRHGLVIL